MEYINHLKLLHNSLNDKTSEKFDARKMRFLKPYLILNWKNITLSLFLMLVVSIITLPVPYLTKYIIDSVLPEKDLYLITLIVGIIAALYIIRSLLSLTINYLFSKINIGVQISMRRDIFKKILSLPLTFFQQYKSGYLLARLNEIQSISIFFSSSMLGLIIDFLEMVFLLVILFMFNVKMTLMVLCFVPIYLIVFKKFKSGLIKSSRNLLEKTANLSKSTQESITGINVIKSFSAEERESLKISKDLKHYYNAGITQNIFFSTAIELVILISSISSLLILWASMYNIIGGAFTIGMYIAFATYSMRFFAPIQKFASASVTIQPAIAALSRVTEIARQIADDEDNNRKIVLKRLKGDIEFKNVFFGYEKNNQVLTDINFHIYPGEKVAIVGPSGAGKSTLTSLILQFYKPQGGKILFDGIDSSKIIMRCIRERIGLVSQEIFLFDDTIRNNIKYGNPDADEEEIIRVAKAANAYDFIQTLPDAFDTIIGERGISLSVGQRQRVSIARALIANPDIYIFDEATSALDSISQKEIQDFIINTKGKTIIIIAHSRNTVLLADRIAVLDAGIIEQFDKASQLMESSDLFNKLFESR